MADPLRRTLLAKLRGKKSKKGATVGGGGFGSAAANGSREGKEKVLQTQRRSEARPVPVVLLAERMSTYENCVDAALFHTAGVLIREDRGELAGPHERSGVGGVGRVGGGVQVSQGLLGVPLQTEEQLGGGDEGHRGLISGDRVRLSAQVPVGHRTHFVSVQRQCSGDSIGFGDNSSHVLLCARVEPHSGVTQTEGPGPAAGAAVRPLRDGTDTLDRGQYWGLAAANKRNANCVPGSSEENIVIRNIESYGSSPEFPGDIRGLQSPTFFPTELEVRDVDIASMCTRDGPLRYHLESEDDDYYDNEILPFYEAVRAKGDGVEVEELPQAGRDKADGTIGARETDRLRSQLKEAYYLLINAMNDINMDVQQISGGLTEQQAASSCSSRSQESLCSARNMDSDSWSSGGDHSPQQASDTDSLLLCIGGNADSGFEGRRKSKSARNLSLTETRSTLLRSASDGAISYTDAASGPRRRSPGICTDKSATAVEGAKEVEGGDLVEPQVFYDAVSIGGDDDRPLNESSGSVNSLTGSSDGSADRPASRRLGNKQELAAVQVLEAASANKAHGVTVNKMQEWMHKGRLLSSEMKQRIEGSLSPPPRAGVQIQDRFYPQGNLGGGCHPGAQVRAVISTKAKSPSPNRVGKPAVKLPGQSSAQQQQQQQPAFIENAQSSCTNSREADRANEPPSWRPPLNTITVSKKRNWLQQSSLAKSNCIKDEMQGALTAEEESSQNSHQLAALPSPSSDHLKPSGEAVPRPGWLQLPQISIGHVRVSPQPCSLDPAEENDADDEGEIWYNPIPEDDVPDVSHRPSVRLLVPARAEVQAPQRRPSRRGIVGRGCSILDSSSTLRPEGLGENLSGGGALGDGSHGNGVHSTETLQLPRQMIAWKPQEEGGPYTSRATDGPDLPNTVGFTPPSSPNPAKKSSSINWSFPDKIKSPRTVRKISMKMKKLPELSRKLSVKGNPSSSHSNNTNGSNQLEPRANSPRNNTSGAETVPHPTGPARLSAPGGGQASRNVISRYHLDSSVSTQHSFSKKKNNGSSKSASKGGYLSDGDSPELVAKSEKHGSAEGKGVKSKEIVSGGCVEKIGGGGSPKLNGTELDIDAFRHYSFMEQPKCSQYISGLMSLHFYGAEDLKPPRIDSRDVYCAIQVDSVNKARTALLTCRTTFLDMDHTFNIELENAQHLKLVVFSWEPTPRRNRVCCHGTVVLPALFRVTRSHQLAVKLEPRGLIYVKLSLMEQWQNSLDRGSDRDREPQVFGVEVWRVVDRENTGLMVPLLISKCITEIEKRGCQVVGLYRLCGSAAVKKELREAFERDSHAAELCENTYPDINVITGVLKDYLRELPYPLITKQLYEAVLDSMAARPLRIGAAGCENDQADSEHAVSLLDNLPDVERMTLRKLLDHLKLVASYQEVNKMTCQNLAVCFGPVLLSQRQDASCHTNRVFIDSEELASALHFKKHIEVLHYLLQLWPVIDPHSHGSSHLPLGSSDPQSAPPLRRRKERPQVLNLTDSEIAGVLRPKAGRLDSPSNRYAGDWSVCGESYFPSEMLPLPPAKEEADYDDVASEDAEVTEERLEDTEGENGRVVTSRSSDAAEQERAEREEEEEEEEAEKDGEPEEERHEESDGSANSQPFEEEERVCEHILPPRLPKEHTYQAFVKIQDISPVLSNRVNLRDLQESIDTLIGNLERELNKNKLNVGY